MDKYMHGKTVLITGAGGGIGRATAILFAGHGATLFLCDIKQKALEDVEDEIKKLSKSVKVVIARVDLSMEEEIKKVLAYGIENLLRIDILLNCAGIGNAGKIVDTSISVWDKVMDINLRSVFLLSREVARQMIENHISGCIINISSQNSKIAEFANGVYSCSKAAVNTLTQTMAQELAEYGIRVNSICPGYVNTEMMGKAFRERGPIEGKTPDKYKEELCRKIPLKRMAEPEDISNVLLFLASEESAYITGIALTVAGGTMLI